MERTALISECGRYRYKLGRSWDPAGPRVVFVMLNPSTADALQDDPTIRRCIGFAQAWGYGSLEVRNLFAFRATNPKDLNGQDDPFGPGNDSALVECRGSLIVAAWGKHSIVKRKGRRSMALLGPDLQALRIVSGGAPGHPLYLPGKLKPIPFFNGAAT